MFMLFLLLLFNQIATFEVVGLHYYNYPKCMYKKVISSVVFPLNKCIINVHGYHIGSIYIKSNKPMIEIDVYDKDDLSCIGPKISIYLIHNNCNSYGYEKEINIYALKLNVLNNTKYMDIDDMSNYIRYNSILRSQINNQEKYYIELEGKEEIKIFHAIIDIFNFDYVKYIE